MTKKVLDTNAYTGHLKGDAKVKETIERATAIFLPVIVIGELLEAFRGGNRELENKELLYKFLNQQTVSTLDISTEIAEIYSDIKYSLRKKGKPIPTNDIWIAASTMEIGAVLITYDKHFTKIPGLRIWDY